MNGYTLTKVKNFMGREGTGFNAILNLNGKPLGMVIDSGNGGCLSFQLTHADYKPFEELAKELYPDVRFEPEADLIHKLLLIADMNRKRNTVYLLTEQQVKEFWDPTSDNYTAHFSTSAPLSALLAQKPQARVWDKELQDFKQPEGK